MCQLDGDDDDDDDDGGIAGGDAGIAGGDVHSINETLKIKRYYSLGYIRISKKLMKQTTVHTLSIFSTPSRLG